MSKRIFDLMLMVNWCESNDFTYLAEHFREELLIAVAAQWAEREKEAA